jgi:hypothetical protein
MTTFSVPDRAVAARDERLLRAGAAAYDRARKNLDRHPNYILAAYMASGT